MSGTHQRINQIHRNPKVPNQKIRNLHHYLKGLNSLNMYLWNHLYLSHASSADVRVKLFDLVRLALIYRLWKLQAIFKPFLKIHTLRCCWQGATMWWLMCMEYLVSPGQRMDYCISSVSLITPTRFYLAYYKQPSSIWLVAHGLETRGKNYTCFVSE